MSFAGRVSVTALMVLLCGASMGARVVINEALVNEPGGATTLEWFELYNSADTAVALAGWAALRGGDQIDLSTAPALGAHGFVVVTRNADAFATVWGDRNGVWGDALTEDFPLIEAAFTLPNVADSLLLVSPAGDTAKLVWPSGGADAVSWERGELADDSALQSLDAAGATPGRVNSRTPLPLNLALEFLGARADGSGFTELAVRVRNRGLSAASGGGAVIISEPVHRPGEYPALSGALLARLTYSTLAPDSAVELHLTVTLPGLYAALGCELELLDDNLYDNVILFTAPGAQFPPAALTEFLANPTPPYSTEWIEIRNLQGGELSLDGWTLSDNAATTALGAVTLEPLSYAVLTQDSLEFGRSYPAVSAQLVAVEPWRTLNNDGDVIVLRDQYGIVVDSFAYAAAWPDNRSWARTEPTATGLWGRSADPGGTPGAINVALGPATGADLRVAISPNPFSPDGDLIDDTAYIAVTAPAGAEMTVRIFDRHGAAIRTLVSEAPFSALVAWDGRNDDGRRAPIGIYIVYASVDDTHDFKTTVVIAR
ncbi:MAG TPA: lamin tail domain-containing protein [candidate division Zixibacteria bacterium]|nr:lamin tail domain-containing protein [candidate division Zixibacteria bacterium]